MTTLLEDFLVKLLPGLIGLVGALFGGGVVWGLTRAKLVELERRLVTTEMQCKAFVTMCRSSQEQCAGNVHRRLDKVAEDVAFIRGILEGQKG